jgi:hypothetical protein
MPKVMIAPICRCVVSFVGFFEVQLASLVCAMSIGCVNGPDLVLQYVRGSASGAV